MQGQQTSSGFPSSVRNLLPQFNLSRPYTYQATPMQRYRTNSAERNQQMAKALGWFSIGLGVVQLLAPRAISRAVGAADRPMLMRAIAMREIAAGVGILGQRKPTPWLWARVAGDAMDLTLLGLAARRARNNSERSRVGAVSAAVAGIAVLDVLSSVRNTEHQRIGTEKWSGTGTVHVEKSVTINASADECYRFWRDFNNLSQFMQHLESVQTLDDKRSHWKARAPMGTSIEWDAEVTIDQPGKLIAWRSVEGSQVDNAGTVTFESAPGGRGTIVRVQLQYSPPGGKAGALLAKLFREEPSQQIDEDLRNFKRIMETGEIPTTVGQPSGRRDAITRLLFRKGAPG